MSMQWLENHIDFKVHRGKVALIAVALLVAVIALTKTPEFFSPEAVAEREEEQFAKQIEQGEIEPVRTEDLRVTSDGFVPQFALIEFTPGIGDAQVRIINADTRTRTIVVGENDARTMRPGYEFILTFGRPRDIEVWDQDDHSIR